MDFTDERYVRVYTRDTATWKMLGWQAKCLLPLLLRKCDRAGVIEFGSADMAQAVTALIDVPIEVVAPGLQSLAEREVLELHDQWLVFPNFIDAQEAATTDRQRAAECRARRRDRARRAALTTTKGDGVTKRDRSSQNVTLLQGGTDDAGVTKRDRSSQNVTDGSSGDGNPGVTKRDRSSQNVTADEAGAGARVTKRDIPDSAKSQSTARDDDTKDRSFAHEGCHTPSHGVTPSLAVLDLKHSTEVVEDLSGSARDASPPTATHTKPRPPVRPKELFPKPIPIGEYEPLAEHAAYAAAVGLDARAFDETVRELRQRETQRHPMRPTALVDYLDSRLNQFIDQRAKQSRRSSPRLAARTPEAVTGGRDPSLSDLDPETLAALGPDYLEGA